MDTNDIDCKLRVVESRNKDFEYGTYRITKCGTYILMEDVTLNMNAAPLNDININNYYWYPTNQQMSNLNESPSNNFIGPYCMGLLAGIKVESDDVVIDLNTFSLKMSKDFCIQQRFPMLIELGSKPFLSGQRHANFGSVNVRFASNIIIKNGILGLNSHDHF